jgi:hypothetical protein
MGELRIEFADEYFWQLVPLDECHSSGVFIENGATAEPGFFLPINDVDPIK